MKYRLQRREPGGQWVTVSEHAEKDEALEAWRDVVASVDRGGLQVVDDKGNWIIRVTTPGTLATERSGR